VRVVLVLQSYMAAQGVGSRVPLRTASMVARKEFHLTILKFDGKVSNSL
jgi:hypothetical protein